jgi:hypothetical protein
VPERGGYRFFALANRRPDLDPIGPGVNPHLGVELAGDDLDDLEDF